MVMMILCGLSLVYFIILQPLMNFYSLLLYLEKPPGEIKEQYGSVFANWSSESLERLTNNTFVFSLGQFANVLESFEYPWSFDRTVMVLSGLLNVCQFVLLLREMAFNRRFASLCCPEICGASSEALAKSTPSRSRKSKTAKVPLQPLPPQRRLRRLKLQLLRRVPLPRSLQITLLLQPQRLTRQPPLLHTLGTVAAVATVTVIQTLEINQMMVNPYQHQLLVVRKSLERLPVQQMMAQGQHQPKGHHQDREEMK